MTSDDYKTTAKDTADQAGRTAREASDAAKETASNLKRTAQDVAGRVSDRAKDVADHVANAMPDSATDAVARGQKAIGNGGSQVASQVKKQPLEALLLAAAIGYLVGWATNRG